MNRQVCGQCIVVNEKMYEVSLRIEQTMTTAAHSNLVNRHPPHRQSTRGIHENEVHI